MSGSFKSFTHQLLLQYYATVVDLRSYLSDIMDDGSNNQEGRLELIQPGDLPSYVSLLTTSVVGSTGLCDRRLKVARPLVGMREIIDRAQEKLFSRACGKPSNVITQGYRSAAKNSELGRLGMQRQGISNYFVNTIVTALQAPEWQVLLERVGDDVVLHLLTDTSVFVALPNSCFCQITGEPIIHTKAPGFSQKPGKKAVVEHILGEKRKADGPHNAERRLKRARSDGAVATLAENYAPVMVNPSKLNRTVLPADVSFVRARLFYSRPSKVPTTDIIAIGLPPHHILNAIYPAYQKRHKVPPDQYIDPDPKIQMDNARRLLKYVFPRQYGLANVFTTERDWRHAYAFPDYTDRETEIKAKGPCKTPLRLKRILPIMEKLIWRHGKCGYKPLRDRTCPSKLKSNSNEPLDSSVILELMSENSQLRTQAPDISDRSLFVNTTFTSTPEVERKAREKPRFLEFACNHVAVFRYAVVVTKAVIPKAMWGSETNFKLVMRHVKDFITRRRYETLTLHSVLQGYRITDCDWLLPMGAARGHIGGTTDYKKRRELLEEFMYWYFDSFLLSLIKTTFYATDSSALRNQVLYFRHDDWDALCKPLIERLTSSTFEKLEQHEVEEILKQRKLGYSFVRLMPKETGVRPIVNLRRKAAKKQGRTLAADQSINQILQAAFQILTYEKELQPHRIGASVFNHNDVYVKLKAFKSRLAFTHVTGSVPKLYFVKVDVQACFDTIDQSKLLQIVREMLSEDVYMIRRHGQVSSVTEKMKRVYVKKACPGDEHTHFLSYATELAGMLHNLIFVDQVVYPFAKKQEILALLEEHVTENIVKIGQDFYRQMVGIPQGSVLSVLLCSFFYGDLERRHFKFAEDPESVLLRMVDDYLLITTSLPRAHHFLDIMNTGHPEYGCFISKDKTLTNFDHGIDLMNVTAPHQQTFPWCGYLINMTDLSVSWDYSRVKGTSVPEALTVDLGRRPGASFIHKMLRLTKHRSHIIFCDMDLNCERTVYLNIYQNFVLCALKMQHYLRSWGLDVLKHSDFIHNTVRQMISYTTTAVRRKVSNKVVKSGSNPNNSDICRVSIVWLGTHAFHALFSFQPEKYRSLIQALQFELSLPRYRQTRKRFRTLVKEALSDVVAR